MSSSVGGEYDVAVVGGGIGGLIAGYLLRDRRTVVLEGSERVGGRVKSWQRGQYWVNLGAQFLAGEGPLWGIAQELGVESASLRGSHPALVLGEKFVVSEAPLRFARELPLSPAGRLAMIRLGLTVRRTYKRLARSGDADDARRFRDELDRVSSSEYFSRIRNHDVQEVLRAFVRFWMGVEPEEVSAGHTALYVGLSLSSLTETPPFSLVIGGNERLPQAIAAALGSRVELGARVEEVQSVNDAVRVRYTQDGEARELRAHDCVVAVPADVALQIVRGLPADKRRALEAVQYGTYVSAGFFTSEQGAAAWDRIYAATVAGRSFQVIINPATVQRKEGRRDAGGALLLYAGGQPAKELLALSDGRVIDLFRRDLQQLIPELRGRIDDVVVQRWPRAIPYWRPGGRAQKDALRASVGRIHFAADYVAYPSMQVAATAATRVARKIAADRARLAAR